jgi:hypothetical protein
MTGIGVAPSPPTCPVQQQEASASASTFFLWIVVLVVGSVYAIDWLRAKWRLWRAGRAMRDPQAWEIPSEWDR